ncbi:hypothetical protein LguiB_003130 [Lonicera macranthoides]
MIVGRVASRLSRSVLAQSRNSLLLLYAPQKQHHLLPISNQFHSLSHPQKVVPVHVPLLNHSNLYASPFQRFGISSFASPQTDEKETSQTGNEQGSTGENNNAATKESGEAEVSDKKEESDSDSGEDLSMDDLVKLVAEKEELLKTKHKEIEQMQDKVLRTYAEMENVMDRTRREAENSKKFAIQNFAKSLLDVADNLGRASSVVKESFSKLDTSQDTSGAVPLLKTLLEGVEMTEKQLTEVFKKYGVEKYDPTDEQFDPHRHNAVFQVPDPSKAPDTVAVVLKPGYMLHERIIRPAEVGVTIAVNNNEADQEGS